MLCLMESILCREMSRLRLMKESVLAFLDAAMLCLDAFVSTCRGWRESEGSRDLATGVVEPDWIGS